MSAGKVDLAAIKARSLDVATVRGDTGGTYTSAFWTERAQDDIDTLCDEVGRLRKALREIAEGKYDDPMRRTPESMARAALDGEAP